MKKYLRYIIPSLVTFTILGIIYYFNDLYPFGARPLVQVDADYTYIPTLYKIYDLLHGSGSIFYSDIGFGNSIYAALITQGSLYSPLNLILYLVHRDSLVNFFGIFIMIKLCLISFTCYIYINDKYPTIKYFYKLLFTIAYTFNGFIILNYFNHSWLDIVILFPLLIMYLNRVLKNKDGTGYIIVLSLSLIISFYCSYFVIIYILFYSLIYLHNNTYIKKKEIIFKLGKYTIIALLISSFSSIPLMYQILTSERFSQDGNVTLFGSIAAKSLYILFTPVFVVYFIRLMTKYKQDKRRVFMRFILAILYLIPVIIDPINALIHGGSYWSFPYRYGYITTFILMDCSLYYIYKYNKDVNSKLNFMDMASFVTIIWLGIFNLFLNNSDRKGIILDGIILKIHDNTYIKIIIMITMVFLMYIMLIFIRNKYLKKISLVFVSLYAIFLFTSWTIYYNPGYFLSANARDESNHIKAPNDGRYKVENGMYPPFYGYIYQIDTLDNWLHIVPKGEGEAYKRLGYMLSGTSLRSYGGTIFTDWLLNINYLFATSDKSNDDMYQEIASYNKKRLYKLNYHQNNGIVFKKLMTLEEKNKFKYQNMIYRNLYGIKKDIVKVDEYYYKDLSTIKFNYHIDETGYLYFDTDDPDNIYYIVVGEDRISNYDKYIKYLGTYNQDVEIRIYLREAKNMSFSLGFIKKNDIIELESNVKKINTNTYQVEGKVGEYLLLPINSIPGIKVYDNHKLIDHHKYLDNFIYIDLLDGENNIEIKYELPYFKLSVILSILGIILFILNKRIIANKQILEISYILYITVVSFVFIYFYIYSFFKYLM